MFVSLLVCLFGFFIVPLNNFSLIWRHHHCRWRTAIFDLCSTSWTLSSEDSLACHTDFDTGHSFIMVIFEDPWHWHLHVLPSVQQWTVIPLLSRLGFKHPTVPPPHAVFSKFKWKKGQRRIRIRNEHDASPHRDTPKCQIWYANVKHTKVRIPGRTRISD